MALVSAKKGPPEPVRGTIAQRKENPQNNKVKTKDENNAKITKYTKVWD
jgi:hypothetical protein